MGKLIRAVLRGRNGGNTVLLPDHYEKDGKEHKLYGFVAILGYSRMRFITFVKRCDTPTMIRCMMAAFEYFEGLPKAALTDRIKSVFLDMDGKTPIWNPIFADFAACLGITPRVCKPYKPQTKGTVEALFRWMTQRFERRLLNTSHGVHDAEAAAQAGAMTLEELERYFFRAIVDDYQQSWDGLRRQTRAVLWEEAVRQTGVPQYLGAPDDLKLLLMKAVNRKTLGHRYQVHDGSRLSFQGRWYTCPGLLNRLQGKEFELYYDRGDVGVLYLFVEGSYVGEAYCPAFMGRRVSEWEATAQHQADAAKAKATASASANVRAQIQEEIDTTKKQRKRATREQEYSRQFDRQREEIHPAHVLETLATLHPPAPSSLRLPEAKPDPDREYPVQILPIRPYETENDS